jgi:hypothetical protein
MRFHYGAVPEPATFHPEAQGWASIREPGPLLLNVLALPTALLMLGLTIGLLLLAWEGGPPTILRDSAAESTTSPLLLILGIILLSIPVHEVVHAVTHPHFGLSSNSILGLWLSRGLFYAHYEGEMSRNRFLAILAMPLLVLSLLPVAIIAFIGSSAPTMVPGYLVIVALVNSALSSGDAVGFALILGQIPSSAVVRNKGWDSFWKHRTSEVA